jgi:sarcosine oxidase subunit delta
MLRIDCPVCGLRDETEFTYGGDASVVLPSISDASPERWCEAVFVRDNLRGAHRELWHHDLGCRQWLIIERDTLTHEIGACRLAREARG